MEPVRLLISCQMRLKAKKSGQHPIALFQCHFELAVVFSLIFIKVNRRQHLKKKENTPFFYKNFIYRFTPVHFNLFLIA